MIPPLPVPSVVSTLQASPPESLLWNSSPSKTSLRQLSAAFEDIIGTHVDWRRIEELRTCGPIDAMEYALQNPVHMGSTGVPVYVLGICHSSDHSCEHISKMIDSVNPGVVALESCVDRTEARRAIQLPLVERFKGDWIDITDLAEFSSDSVDPSSRDKPTMVDFAKHGLIEGNLDNSANQFLLASGSVLGSPELTALYETKARSIPLESVDILESIKIVQNASIDSIGYTARHMGDISEGVLRQVVDEETILSEYFRILFSNSQLSQFRPSLLYRLIESRKRSPVYADLLLRELHRVYRPKQYWARIFLRDLYMAFRIHRLTRRSAENHSGPVLVIVGAAHAFGVRDLLSQFGKVSTDTTEQVFGPAVLATLIDSAQTLNEVWRSVLGMDSFSTNFEKRAKAIAVHEIVDLLLPANGRATYWVESSCEWQLIELPSEVDRTERLRNFTVTGVGQVDLVQALIEGRIDPYSVARQTSQAMRE